MTVNPRELFDKGLVFSPGEHAKYLEDKEIAVEGDLAEFLKNTFFSGAVENGVMTKEIAAAIPEIINDVLHPILLRSGSQSRADILSSVAREIAWTSITGQMPEQFWPLYRESERVGEKLNISRSSIVREYADQFAKTHIDVDVMLTNADKVDMKDIGRKIASEFNIAESDIHTTALQQDTFRFQHKGYTIEVLAGPHPTAPIEFVKIYIRNPQTQIEVFHIDVTKAGSIGDKRSILTTSWQDSCFADLRVDESGRLRYAMTKQSVDVLLQPDSYDAEDVNKAGAILEIFTRGLFRRLLHQYVFSGQEQIRLPNNQWLTIPDFSMLLPIETNATESGPTLFKLRSTIVSLLLKHEEALPYNNPDYLGLLQKELHLCLQADPFMTIQALRDSGISYLIPGLRSLTRDQWNMILRSKYFMMDLSYSPRGARLGERDYDYIKNQREIYLGRTDGKFHFDGLERFIRALGGETNNDYQGKEYETYLHLWDEQPEMEDLQTLSESATEEIKRFTYDPSIRDAEQELLHSIGLISAILRNSPTGLTALEIENIYTQHVRNAGTYNCLDFTEAFRQLKFTGFVTLDTMNRVDKHGKIVPVDMYTWNEPMEQTDLMNLADDNYFFDRFVSNAIDIGIIGQQSPELSNRRNLSRILNELKEGKLGIPKMPVTAEVILSLSPDLSSTNKDFPGTEGKMILVRKYIHVLQQTYRDWKEFRDDV